MPRSELILHKPVESLSNAEAFKPVVSHLNKSTSLYHRYAALAVETNVCNPTNVYRCLKPCWLAHLIIAQHMQLSPDVK